MKARSLAHHCHDGEDKNTIVKCKLKAQVSNFRTRQETNKQTNKKKKQKKLNGLETVAAK